MPLSLAGATLGAAAIGGGTNLLGNLIGSYNNNKTNKMNYKIAQMNNQYNSLMFDKQIQYNTEMWNKQNEYNTPLAQRQRYEAAGINPYNALGNIQSGQAQSAGGVNPPSAQGSTMQSFTPDFSGVSNAAQNYINNKLAEQMQNSTIELNDQKIEQMKIQNEYLAADFSARIENMKEQTKNWKLRSFYQGVQNRYAADMFAGQRDNIIREGQMLDTTIRASQIEIALNEIHLNNLPKQYQLSFANTAADTQLLYAQGKLTKEQAYHELQKKFKTMQETYGLKINNRILDKTANDIIEKTHKENAGYYWQMGADALGSVVNGVVGFGLGRLNTLLTPGRAVVKGYR